MIDECLHNADDGIDALCSHDVDNAGLFDWCWCGWLICPTGWCGWAARRDSSVEGALRARQQSCRLAETGV